MFEYFPGNYVWNLGVVATLNSGGLIDEVDRACRPIRESAAHGEDAGTADFLRAWTALTDSLVTQAEAAEKAGHVQTAGQLYARAANYLCQAERMQSAKAPDRLGTYRRVLQLQLKAFALKDPRLSRVEIPYEGTTLSAYFSQAPATDDGPAPVMIMWNGLDGRIGPESAFPLLTAYLVAALDTTVYALGSYLRFLAEDPGLWTALKADPALIGSGFEETLRMETPTQGFYRTTTRDVDVDGVLVPARSRVLIQNASACRDERHYPEPDRFDLHRNPADHLGFGYGIHSCTGQGLARIEAQALIGSLLRRARSIQLASQPVRHLHPTLRGLERLPVTVVSA